MIMMMNHYYIDFFPFSSIISFYWRNQSDVKSAYLSGNGKFSEVFVKTEFYMKLIASVMSLEFA